MGQTVACRVRGHWRRWVVVVVVVSVLCVLHPLALVPWGLPQSYVEWHGGWFRQGPDTHYWGTRSAFGRRTVWFAKAGAVPDRHFPYADSEPMLPPRWAPMHPFDLGRASGDGFSLPDGRLYGFGVPFVAARSAQHVWADGTVRWIGIVRRSSAAGVFVWPTWVYWPGMIGNVLVWNAAGLVVLVGIDAWVGLRRIRRGRCVRCGYEIGVGATACPECGVGMEETERRRDGETK